jgi:HPr kinase/phosphorylase
VQLEEWDESQNYERIGIDDTYTSILNVQVPTVRLPIFPGKNITVIAEVLALNQILKIHGDNSAQVFNERLIATMQGKKKADAHSVELLDLDYE